MEKKKSKLLLWLQIHVISRIPLRVYQSAKDIFVKPKAKFYAHRRGYSNSHWVIHMPGSEYHWERGVGGGYRFKDSVQRVLQTLHMTWLRPTYDLPSWFYIHFEMDDLGWKTKWWEYRFETRPYISFTFFLWEFEIIWHAPVNTRGEVEDSFYWESLMEFIWCDDYVKHKKPIDEILRELTIRLGRWSNGGGWQMDANYVKPPYDELIAKVCKEQDEKLDKGTGYYEPDILKIE